MPGDKIKRQEQGDGQGQGGEASNEEGDAEDNFAFEISREEFLELFSKIWNSRLS